MTFVKLLLLCLLCVMQGLLSGCQIRDNFKRSPISDLYMESDWNEAFIDAFQRRSELVHALDLSLHWFDKPESLAFYPVAGITHEEARESTQRFRDFLLIADNPDDIALFLNDAFYMFFYNESVTFTGYFAPEYEGSSIRNDEYRYPLYSVPVKLVFDSISNNATGWKTRNGVVDCPVRSQLQETDMLNGLEIAWLKDPVDAYVIHVNGSGRIILSDGKHINVGHAATNGLTYTSIGKLLIENGHIKAEDMSLQAIREYFDSNPDQFNHYALQNDRFVFFQLLEDSGWPRGSLGLKLSSMLSIATDKQVYPPGCVALVITDMTSDGESKAEVDASKPLIRFMVDQDSGGAIKTPGRVDIYMGIGSRAGEIAGRQISQGKIYYPLIKR